MKTKYHILPKSQSTHDWLTHKQPHNFLLRLIYFLFVGYGVLIMMITMGMAFDGGFSWWAVAFLIIYLLVAFSLITLAFLPTSWLNKPNRLMKYWTWGVFSLILVVGIAFVLIDLLKS